VDTTPSRHSLRRFLALSAAAACLSGCPSRTDDAARAAPSSAPAAQGTARYTSSELGFSVVFPFDSVPKVEDLPPRQTAIGEVQVKSHHVSRGDTAFDIEVAQYAPGSLAKDLPGLVRVDRDSVLQNKSAKLVAEREVTFSGPDAQRLAGVELELTLPDNYKVFRTTCFFGDRGYTLAAAGPALDPALNAAAFRRFVDSFRLTAAQ